MSATKPPPSTSQLVRLGTARCLSRVAAVLEEGGSVELLSARVFGGDMVQASIFSQNISSAATILDLYLGDSAAGCTGCLVVRLSATWSTHTPRGSLPHNTALYMARSAQQLCRLSQAGDQRCMPLSIRVPQSSVTYLPPY